MTESDSIIVDTTERIFSDLCDPQAVNSATDDGWKKPLWDALEESGLTLAWVPEDCGGAGVPLTDGFDILRAAGKFAVPVPLAETLLAGWLLGEAGLACPAGAMAVAPQRPRDRITLGADGTLSGIARRVPFAPEALHIAVLAFGETGAEVALVETKACSVHPRTSVAGDPTGDIDFTGVRPVATAPGPAFEGSLALMGATANAALMAGALEAILDMSVAYAKERVAFGRPLAKFQAVQQNLATLGCEAAAAAAAVNSAADTLQHFGDHSDDAVLLEVASAKIRAGEAAGQGAAIAHQAHGAIGFTVEYVLNRFTRRLWAWRDQFGSESEWALRLGTMVAKNGADALWPLVASR